MKSQSRSYVSPATTDMGSVVIDRFAAILAAAVPFVEARRKPSGGFGATPRLPATIEDTYHALNILGLARQYDELGKGFDLAEDENLRSYLEGCRRTLSVGSRMTFQLLWCCRTAGLALDSDAVEAAVLDRIQTAVSLDDWYYCAGILVEVLGRKPAMKAGERHLAAVLNRHWRSVDEAWMHLYLSRIFGLALPRSDEEMISWFRACQNGDGGFGFFPGTTSFVENCHSCLRALDALGAVPADPERAGQFLAGCQTAFGGFGRGLRATAFLDTTWHAVAALSLLN